MTFKSAFQQLCVRKRVMMAGS